jgi:hypothetical protein
MRLFESIIDANHRAVAGDASAGLHPAEFADALPVVALTCNNGAKRLKLQDYAHDKQNGICLRRFRRGTQIFWLLSAKIRVICG